MPEYTFTTLNIATLGDGTANTSDDIIRVWYNECYMGRARIAVWPRLKKEKPVYNDWWDIWTEGLFDGEDEGWRPLYPL